MEITTNEIMGIINKMIKTESDMKTYYKQREIESFFELGSSDSKYRTMRHRREIHENQADILRYLLIRIESQARSNRIHKQQVNKT